MKQQSNALGKYEHHLETPRKILKASRNEPGAAGWESQKQPSCQAAP